MYEYAARLVRTVDADTWILDVDLGMHVWQHGVRIRAAGINAPELSTQAGQDAHAWADQWFAQHCPDGTLTVKTQKDRNDNYGRLLGIITAPDGAVLNTDLLDAGHAQPWPRKKATATTLTTEAEALRQHIAAAIHHAVFPHSNWDHQPHAIRALYLTCADAATKVAQSTPDETLI